MKNKEELWVLKVGGKVLEDEMALATFLDQLATSGKRFILVHGGGKHASALAEKLGIPQQMVDGRRITDEATLELALMSYAGLLNKKVVAQLQGRGINAVGLSGADGNTVPAMKRPVGDIDYGWVGDPIPGEVNKLFLLTLLHGNLSPVFCALTHDKMGHMLNTNADTMAQTLAIAMSHHYRVKLLYLFEKKGVLRDLDREDSLIPLIRRTDIQALSDTGVISEGMLPKLQNAAKAVEAGVEAVLIGAASQLPHILSDEAESATHVID
ncbi:MAG: acetylglutamate kinase [Bacteroidetes bacterium]|nr:MAG: acetylglutamate kinase [Bacteroidota bacterium]